MDIKHQFQTKSHNLSGLFDKVNTLSKFMRSLEAQSLIDPLRYDSQKYLGDGFEFFIELFLALHSVDNRVGVYNYKPNQENDNGVDGTGVNILLEPSVVQVKYRSNTKDLLTATKDHLSNLFSDGMLAHNVIADTTNAKNYRHFVFTTADGLHFYTDQEMFKNKVKCIGYKELKGMIDNNLPFWEKVREVVKEIDPKLKTKD
jgi:hypothetical protein